MRKITHEAIQALYNQEKFKKDNTSVEVHENVTVLKLHGNTIALLYNDPNNTLSVTNAGWFSNTTKERLNGLPNVSISQKKGIWYLNGEKWDGKLIDIKNK